MVFEVFQEVWSERKRDKMFWARELDRARSESLGFNGVKFCL